MKPYGELGLVRIADTLPELVAAVEASLAEKPDGFIARVDHLLGQMSWDPALARAEELLGAAVEGRRRAREEGACSIT